MLKRIRGMFGKAPAPAAEPETVQEPVVVSQQDRPVMILFSPVRHLSEKLKMAAELEKRFPEYRVFVSGASMAGIRFKTAYVVGIPYTSTERAWFFNDFWVRGMPDSVVQMLGSFDSVTRD